MPASYDDVARFLIEIRDLMETNQQALDALDAVAGTPVLWYLILCSVLMVAQFFVERHFSRGYGSTGRARQRLRDIGVEQGGRITVEGDAG